VNLNFVKFQYSVLNFVLIAKYLGVDGTVFDTTIKSWFFVTSPVKRFTN
jgi:hypothetical protein